MVHLRPPLTGLPFSFIIVSSNKNHMNNSPRSGRETPRMPTSRAALAALLMATSGACAPNLTQREPTTINSSVHSEITPEEQALNQTARRALDADRGELSAAITNALHANGLAPNLGQEFFSRHFVGLTRGDMGIATQESNGIQLPHWRLSYFQNPDTANHRLVDVDIEISLVPGNPQVGSHTVYTVRFTESGTTRTIRHTSNR